MTTSQPDPSGHFGPYGGQFVADTLMAPLAELTEAYAAMLFWWQRSIGRSFKSTQSAKWLLESTLTHKSYWRA